MASRLVISAIVVCMLVTPQRADADPAEEAEAYKTLGKSAFKSGKFKECAEWFQKSHQVAPDPKKLFNVGLCYEKAGLFAKALVAFQQYVRAAPKGESIGEAKTRIELLQLKIEKQKVAAQPATTDPVRADPVAADPIASDPIAPPASDPVVTAPDTGTPPSRAASSAGQAREHFALGGTGARAPATNAYKGSSRYRGPPFTLGVGFSVLGDEFDEGIAAGVLYGMKLTSGHDQGNYLQLGAAIEYVDLLFELNMGIGFRYVAPLLIFNAYASVTPGLSIGFDVDDTPGFDLPTSIGLEMNLGSFVLGAAYHARFIDGVTGPGVTLGRNWGH